MQLSIKDAAEALNVGEKTIERWIRTGGLPAYRVAGQYRMNRAMLFEWAASKRIRPADAASPDLPLPAFSEALRAGGVHTQVPGATREEVLRELAALVNLPESVNRDALCQALLDRERLQSTGIGDGIAFPHLRNPDAFGFPSPMIVCAYLRQPVDFQAIDSRPVRILFCPLSPSTRIHLHLLSRLSYALRNADFRALVQSAAPAADLLAAAAVFDNPGAP